MRFKDPVIRVFAERNPGYRIRPRVRAAKEHLTIGIAHRHAKGAVPNSCFLCTGARAIVASDKRFIDAAVRFTQTYILVDVGGGNAEVLKYRTTPQARQVLEANDAGVAVWGMSMTFAPPGKMRSPGVQTQAQKNDLPKRGKQTAEHIAKRNAAREASAGRRLLTRG